MARTSATTKEVAMSQDFTPYNMVPKNRVRTSDAAKPAIITEFGALEQTSVDLGQYAWMELPSDTRAQYLVQALAHMLKAEAWPNSQTVPGWRADARHFRNEAAAAFSPSMRQKINLARLYRRALSELPETIDGQPKLPLPDDCPLTLDELLS